MATFEEDLQYVLDLLQKLAFSALTPANLAQLNDATECIAQIRDASALAQEFIWVFEDHPHLDSLEVDVVGGAAKIRALKADIPPSQITELGNELKVRMSRVVSLCSDVSAVNGWSLSAKREEVNPHLFSRRFDAAAVLATVAPLWAQSLIHRIDQATSHHKLVHTARQGLRQVAA